MKSVFIDQLKWRGLESTVLSFHLTKSYIYYINYDVLFWNRSSHWADKESVLKELPKSDGRNVLLPFLGCYREPALLKFSSLKRFYLTFKSRKVLSNKCRFIRGVSLTFFIHDPVSLEQLSFSFWKSFS